MSKLFKKIAAKLTALVESETGASAVEYALLVGLIAVAVIVAVSTLGGNLAHAFNSVATTLPAP